MTTDNRLRRLYYQSGHRGIKELDIILGNFAEKHLAGLSAAEIDDYEALLEVQENQLFNWLCGVEAVEPAFDTPVWQKIRRFSGV